MSSPRIFYTPRLDATSEGEVAALASVYRFILFESSARKEAAHPDGPDHARKELDDSCAERILHDQR
jgi:hypothetical protein